MTLGPDAPPAQYLVAPPLEEGGPLARIAYLRAEGKAPAFVWVGGMMSDMRGTKAGALHRWAQGRGHAFVRFDFPGLGESTGDYFDGSVSRRLRDTLQVIDELTDGPVVLVGSSMGGWVSLLAARERPRRVGALLLVNPAPNFTEWMWDDFPAEVRDTMRRDGVVHIPSDYGQPTPYAWAWFEDGRAHLVEEDFDLDAPVHIFSGSEDTVVPTARCRELAASLGAELTVVEGGDHSLSRDADIQAMEAVLEGFAKDLAKDS